MDEKSVYWKHPSRSSSVYRSIGGRRSQCLRIFLLPKIWRKQIHKFGHIFCWNGWLNQYLATCFLLNLGNIMVRSKTSLKKVADVADGYPANSHGWYTFDLYIFQYFSPNKKWRLKVYFLGSRSFLKMYESYWWRASILGVNPRYSHLEKIPPMTGWDDMIFYRSFWILSSP